jgi:hypothetical protein
MKEMKRFMAYHHDPDLNFEIVQANWRKLAQVETAKWIRTCYNEEKNMRFCVWLAPSEEELKKIFTNLEVSWEMIIEVNETVPDLWGEDWQKHLEAEATASTMGN